MNEETQTEEAQTEAAPRPEPGDDDRFEVKWTKKSSSSQSVPAGPPPEVSGTSVADLQRQLEEERKRSEELRDRWQRAAADLVNLRKRTEQEREDVQKFAAMVIVDRLLPVLDNFERALSTIPGNLEQLTWIQGIVLIEHHFRAILEAAGLAPIEAQGQPFNPHYHEAMTEQETSEAPPGTVLQEYQRGYTMHGRVIRPALVEVARAPEQPEPEPEATEPEEAEEIAEEAETENVGP
jgi:molecular chaperone GrpE